MYKAISDFFSLLNDHCTSLFKCSNGVRQGDNLLASMLTLFVNYLATELRYIVSEILSNCHTEK